MNLENMTVSFDEFLKYYVKQWKMVLAIIAVFVVMFTGATFVFGDTISVPHSEEYLYYEEQLEWHKEYMKDSILMSVKPTEIYVETVLLDNISDVDKLKNYVVSVEVWEDFDTEYVKKYLPELVKWNKNSETNKVELSLCHITREECKMTMDYLKEKLQETDAELKIIDGSERIEVDEELQFLQVDWYSRIDFLQARLEESEAGFTIQVNPLAAAMTGGLAGLIASFVMVLIMLITKRKLG